MTAMNNNATSGKETSESVDEQRAEWEGRNFAMTVCRNGRLACAGPAAFDLSTEFPGSYLRRVRPRSAWTVNLTIECPNGHEFDREDATAATFDGNEARYQCPECGAWTDGPPPG
jgi:hypothetical protein